MIIIAFWNTNNKKNIGDLLIEFVKEQSIDILILAEAEDNSVLDFLKKSILLFPVGSRFNQITNKDAKVTVLSRLNKTVFKDKSKLYLSHRWIAHHIEIPKRIKFNLISVHFHSKVNWARESMALECVNFSRDIMKIEDKTKCDETILIGDFNMNPFEDGIVSANGLNAVQDINYVSKRPNGRSIDGASYKYFYNPMWNFFGDKTKPLGTHYHRAAGHVSQEWNMYDQVMFRSGINPYLDKDYIHIIDTINTQKITQRFNRPNKKKYSDHLPIILKLKI